MPAARTAAKKSEADGGAGRRGQAYGNDGSSGTDEDFSDHERSLCSPSVHLNNDYSSYYGTP